MSKIIKNATLAIVPGAAEMFVDCAVRMPIGEYEGFLVLAGLTDAVPPAETAFIAARLAEGASSGQ